jgi:hypothetical protein
MKLDINGLEIRCFNEIKITQNEDKSAKVVIAFNIHDDKTGLVIEEMKIECPKCKVNMKVVSC